MISNMIGMGFDGAEVQALSIGIHLTQFLCTVTAISYSWLVSKLLTVLKVLNMFTLH